MFNFDLIIGLGQSLIWLVPKNQNSRTVQVLIVTESVGHLNEFSINYASKRLPRGLVYNPNIVWNGVCFQ